MPDGAISYAGTTTQNQTLAATLIDADGVPSDTAEHCVFRPSNCDERFEDTNEVLLGPDYSASGYLCDSPDAVVVRHRWIRPSSSQGYFRIAKWLERHADNLGGTAKS